jgi:hypothetical protein
MGPVETIETTLSPISINPRSQRSSGCESARTPPLPTDPSRGRKRGVNPRYSAQHAGEELYRVDTRAQGEQAPKHVHDSDNTHGGKANKCDKIEERVLRVTFQQRNIGGSVADRKQPCYQLPFDSGKTLQRFAERAPSDIATARSLK